MPAVTKSDFEIAEKGMYLANLCEIEVKASTLKRDDGSDSKGFFWVWKFKGYRETDKRKEIKSVEITTGTAVSKKDSALKSLLMNAFPDMTFEEMQKYNTDEMIGKSWRIKVGIGQKPDGNEKNVILNIEPSDIDVDPFDND